MASGSRRRAANEARCSVGFKRFLSRGESVETDAWDSLERLAELGREASSTDGKYPTWPIPRADAREPAAPVSPVSVDKKVGEISVPESKKAVGGRRAPSYVWRSQASRAGRAGWADMPERF